MKRLPVALFFLLGCVDMGNVVLTDNSFAITQTADVSTVPDFVTCEFDLTANEDVEIAGCQVIAPSGSPKRKRSCSSSTPESGTRQAGHWSCDIVIEHNAVAGTWVVDYAFARTSSGRERAYGAEILSEGEDIDFVVTSTTPDTTAPIIDDFEAVTDPTPLYEDMGGTLSCLITRNSGSNDVASAGCTFASPSGASKISCISHEETAPNNLWQCASNLIAPLETGSWPVVGIFAEDGNANKTVLDATAIDVLPTGTTSFSVSGAGGAGGSGPPPPTEWPGGPTSDCTLNAAITGCICESSYYTTGYCCDEGYSYSACSTTDLYSVPGGTGAKTGADWANAFDGLPAALVRDRVYWIASGNYGTTPRSMNTAASGSLGITIRKATAAMHGTATGWQAAYGTGQATFGALDFSTNRWTIDGGELGGILIKPIGLYGSGGVYSASDLTGATEITLRNLEIDGNFAQASNQQTQGSCNGVRGNSGTSNVVIDRVEIHNFADDGIEYCAVDNSKIFRTVIHDGYGAGTDGWVISGPCYNGHGDGLEVQCDSDSIEVANSIFYDIDGNAAAMFWFPSGVQNNHVLRNNIFYNPQTGMALTFQNTDGTIFDNNIVWGRANPITSESPCRYGGLLVSGNVNTNFTARNNIFTCIAFTLNEGGGPYNTEQHHFSYNLFGSVMPTEYTAGPTDTVICQNPNYCESDNTADPIFSGIPYSEDPADHTPADLDMSEFVAATNGDSRNSGITLGPTWAWDITGATRPQGTAWDRGCFDEITGGGAGGSGGSGGVPGGSCDGYVADYETDGTPTWSATTQVTPAATITVDFSFWAKPALANTDAGIAVAQSTPIDAWGDAAILIRFSNTGYIQAHIGPTPGTYGCTGACPPYTAGMWYQFVVSANLNTDTYTVQYKPCDGTLDTLVSNAAFRTGAPADSLGYHAAWSASAASAFGYDQVSWTPSGCTPLTCASYTPDAECGSPPDGCGGPPLSCGTCTPPETACDNEYQCCNPDETWCATQGYECGNWINNCDQSISCGSCGVGEQCVNGICDQTPYPTASTTGITDYWCPRWDSLKTSKSGYTIGSNGSVVEYEDITGNLNNSSSDSTIRCVNAYNTNPTAVKCNYHDNSCDEGNLYEDIEASSEGDSGDGTIAFEGIDVTVRRAKIVYGSCDGFKWTGGLLWDSFVDFASQTQGCQSGGSHSDLVQMSEVTSPVWLINNWFHGRNTTVISNAATFITTDYGSETHCWGEPTRSNPARDSYSIGYWYEGNHFAGGNYPLRLSQKTASCAGNAPWARVAHNRWGTGDWYPTSGPVSLTQGNNCFEWVDNKQDDGTPVNVSHPNLETTYGNCTGVDTEPLPTWSMSGQHLSATSCIDNAASCDNIDILGASVVGAGDTDTGNIRWRYSCGGTAGNNSASPCPGACTYQDGGADLWYPYPSCNDSTTCDLMDVCDFIPESTGSYTVKVYSEPGPGANARPSVWKELTFTVNP